MPYLADGTFSPDQPVTTSGAPLDALAQPLPQTPDGTPPQLPQQDFIPFSKQTGMPRYDRDRQAAGFEPTKDVLKSPPKAAAAKPGFAQMKVPSFLEYAQFAAKRDSTADAAVDPATMDDAQYIKYAKEYADTMLPQALLGAGHKVTPEYLKTLTPNFAYQTAQNTDKLREHFKSQKPPPDPNAPLAAQPTEYLDYVKQIGAKATSIGSEALAGVARTLSDPRILAGPMGPPLAALVDKVSPTAHKFFDSLDKARGGVPDALAKIGSQTAKNVEGTQTKGFQEKANQPFLHPDQPWITPEGGLNPKKFNANSLNIPNIVGKGEDVMLPLIAFAATRDPAVAASAFGLQASEASKQAETERLGALTPEQWQQVPAYIHKIQEGMPEDQAKAQVVDESAKMQQMVGAVSGSLTGLAGGLPFFKPAAAGFLSRILKNYAVQAPSFAALSGASTAASNVAKTAATGEKINPLAGVGESALTGAVTAAPFAFMGGGHGAPEVKPGAPEAPTATGPADKGGIDIGAGEGAPVQKAVQNAFEDVPIPPKPFASPQEAQAHYGESLAAFKHDLRAGDHSPEEIAGMIPAFDDAWTKATGFDPKTGTPVGAAGAPPVDETAAAAAKAPPDGSEAPTVPAPGEPAQPGLDLGAAPGLDLGARTSVPEAAAAREAVAADHLPEGLRTRVAADLKNTLGREPSNTEIAKQAGHLMDIALEQPGIDKSIPRPALEEALGDLMGKDKTFPDVDAINDLGRKKAANPNQEKITYQPGLSLEHPAGGDVLKKGFDAIAAREKAAREEANKKHDEDWKKAQEITDATQQKAKEQEIYDAYQKRTKEIREQAQKERDNAHAAAEREREIAEQAERKADEANKRDAAGKRKNVLKKEPYDISPERLKRAEEVEKQRKKGYNVLKKAEPVAAEDTATGGDVSRLELREKVTDATHPYAGYRRELASPEEYAKAKPLEDFYKKFTNVHDLAVALRERVTDAGLRRVLDRILANPHQRERLKQERFRVINPEDANDPYTREFIGHYSLDMANGEKVATAMNGFRHSKEGIAIAGAKWKPYSGVDNGMHPITVVHEIVHSATADLVSQIENYLAGKGAKRLDNPVLLEAYDELQQIRQALQKHGDFDKLADKGARIMAQYGVTNVKELLSVSFTDPRVKGVLERIKMGTVDAWRKLLGAVSKMLGLTPADMPVLERIMELGNKFIDYKPPDYENPVQQHAIKDISPENMGEVLHSRADDRVAENTPERVLKAISIQAPKDRIKEENNIAREQNKPTPAGEWERKIFDKLKSLTQAIQLLASKGQTVGPRENIDDGARVFQNLAARAVNIAQQQFIQPMVQKIVELAGKKGQSSDEFLTHLSAWYFGKRALEVNDRGDLEKARLRKASEEQRQAIRDEWAAGKIGAGEYLDKLRAVVNAPGARVENRSPISASGISNETAYELIARARKNGIDKGIIDEFDPMRKRMLEEIDRNYQRSGRHSTFDAARKEALGSKYYVPLKGFGEAADETSSSGLGAFTREYTGAAGRTTIARNPIANLMQELQGSARDVPENGLTKIVYNFAKKYGKEFGLKVRTLDVEKAVQDAIASGGSIADADRSFKNPNTVIHNNGEYRYSIEFPEDSPILTALKSINESRELNTFERMAGTVTNLISRGATTLNPKFLLWNAFWRDTGYVGAQIGMDLGPQAMAEYAGRYWLQGGPLRGRSTYFKNFVQPRNALERDAYAATGKSKFAQSLSEIAKYGGDLSFENELNTVRNMDSIYEALRKAEGKNLSPTERAGKLVTPLVHFLDQIGTSDIMTARVAAYETYENVSINKFKKENGRAPNEQEAVQIKKDAALFSRRVLDYQQRSDISRSLNVVFPFARVVMTQTDRLLTTFKKPDGSYDTKKIAIMTAVGLMAGATYYSLLRQANDDVKKQENSTLAQNFVVPVGDNLVRIPMAYGLTRLFLVPGMMMARAAFGDSSDEDATNEIRNALIEGFLPFKPPEAQHNEKVTGMTPGAMRPFLEIERNKNIFGSQITPMDDRTKGPHYEGGYNSTPETWKWMAKNLHDWTAGAVDVYPESLEYLTGAYGTGPGNAIMRAASIHTKGDATNVQQLPFVPAVTSRDSEFYERREIEHLKEDLESKGKEHLTDEDKATLHEINSSQLKFGKQRAALYKDKLMSKDQRQKLLEQISTQQRGEQAELLRRVNHAK